jgi:hypothetical protein
MTKTVLAVALMMVTLNADRIKITSMACPTMEPFKDIPEETLKDEIKLTSYAFEHGCRILMARESVETLGDDPRNDQSQFTLIRHKESGEELIIRRKNVDIEQPGRKNEFRF